MSLTCFVAVEACLLALSRLGSIFYWALTYGRTHLKLMLSITNKV